MLGWVSLKSGWKLQDVQAGLNVSIAFLCAGAIFGFVRYCWLIAARRVARGRDTAAHSLLSLNTVGEIFDVILLLRYELFTARYLPLLLQCIFVILLTIATLMSGFLARFSTRYGTITRAMQVNGTIAERTTGNILYAEVDTNTTMAALKGAQWPLTQMLDYLPNPEYKWEYVPEQWNGSWTMDCTYNRSIDIPNPRATGNCTGLQREIPQMFDNYWDWYQTEDSFNWDSQSTGWRSNLQEYRDYVIGTSGRRLITWDDDLELYTEIEIRLVTIYLSGVPFNSTIDDSDCNFATGPIDRAHYTSASCKLNRKTEGRTKGELAYGAYPEGYDVGRIANAYFEHFGNNIRKESSRNQTVTTIEAEDMVRFWLAWNGVKDTITSPFGLRTIDTRLQVPQISVICIILCSIIGVFDLFGLISYWLFLVRYWSLLQKTPQSKLDWMLKTLTPSGSDHAIDLKQRMNTAMASGNEQAGGTLLNKVGKDDRVGARSETSSTFSSAYEPYRHDDGFETHHLGSNFSDKLPSTTWFPQQYERVSPHVRHG